MDIGETAALTQFWGVGLIVSMILSGWILIKWLGYMRVLRIGLVVSILVFIGIIVAGAIDNVSMFRILVLVMGLGTGMAGAGMLSIIINFTSNLRAGLLLGVWGFANQLGRALGSLMAGGVVDIMLRVTSDDKFIAYATVFVLEIVMLIIALYLSRRLNVTMSRAKIEEEQVLGSVEAESA
jgi:BCD family chlorophyll transporter-like MFS transporter